jgi:hypothetical protein
MDERIHLCVPVIGTGEGLAEVPVDGSGDGLIGESVVANVS